MGYSYTPAQIADAWVTIMRETGMSRQDWLDALSLPEAIFKSRILPTYAHMDWTKPGTPAWRQVVDALPIIGQVVGLAAGAAMAVQALRGGAPTGP